MKLLFDNCTSPVLTAPLNGFIEHRNHNAIHIKDLPCGRHAANVDWIAVLARTGEDWFVGTGDLRMSRNRAEQQAFRQAGLKGIVLATAYQTFQLNQQASFLLWRWPDVEGLVRQIAAPFLFELPANRTSRIRQLPL